MKWKKRQIVYTAVAVLIVLVTVIALLPDPVPVETATVERGPMAVSIESRGETRVVDRFVITAPVSGRVARIDLREGAVIAQGDVVARIAPMPIDPRQREEGEARAAAADATRREAAAAVSAAESAWGLARRERERVESLSREGVAAGQMLDQVRISEERARLRAGRGASTPPGRDVESRSRARDADDSGDCRSPRRTRGEVAGRGPALPHP
jgi:HlyD family secretion protein